MVGKPEGKRPLRRPRYRWENTVKIDVREIGHGAGVGFICLKAGTVDGLLRTIIHICVS
jgi:hypothetical protein